MLTWFDGVWIQSFVQHRSGGSSAFVGSAIAAVVAVVAVVVHERRSAFQNTRIRTTRGRRSRRRRGRRWTFSLIVVEDGYFCFCERNVRRRCSCNLGCRCFDNCDVDRWCRGYLWFGNGKMLLRLIGSWTKASRCNCRV